ncbi:hypothetical protein EAF04_010429 [Stromatinia cepivora]|nr:hypothetical protein EAF04_010429 [Stromatinia cepivora]
MNTIYQVSRSVTYNHTKKRDSSHRTPAHHHDLHVKVLALPVHLAVTPLPFFANPSLPSRLPSLGSMRSSH